MISRNSPSLDYGRLVRKSRKLTPTEGHRQVRIAILSDAASQQFVPVLRTLFCENGVDSSFYEGAFDSMALEAVNPASGLYEFAPGIIVLAYCTQALRARYYQHQGDFVEESCERILQVWDALAENSSARVIQCNYALPYESQFGNYDLKAANSLYAAAAEINHRIAQSARQRPNVLVCDVDRIAASLGRGDWFDERLWALSKTFCRLDFLPLVGQALVEMVLASMGQVVKCVILDLDNTLWGGVVGDDGPLGIVIGPHGPGEVFYHFQQYLLSLKQRGILLAVCSKNNMEAALQPFLQNPDMVLKREDISVFVANWENKAENIRQIRETLEIGFDSMVFLDDNPFERSLVREFLPEVIVPELPEDPADYVRAVSALNLFETASLSAEDAARAELYARESQRREVRSKYADVEEFLSSLGMKIKVARFEPDKIARIAQLTQRSNQFNLTTNRYNEAECQAMMKDDSRFLPLYASLSDRFGDHGLISVVVLVIVPGGFEIRDWLMSCRVLARGVEQFLMNRVVALAVQSGAACIRARFVPTAKNSMVKEFYAQFGFEKVAETDGRTDWSLDPRKYRPHPVHITECD